MKLIYLSVAVLLVLVAACNAFPLTGGNGLVNASVLGVMPDGNRLCLDVAETSPINHLVLVDSEDRFYDATKYDKYVGETLDRRFYFVEVPENVEIKRVRITPLTGDPFSIEWTGVPDISDATVGMKFYSLLSSKTDTFSKTWLLDVKLTNKAGQKFSLTSNDLAVVDQFGFPYTGYIKGYTKGAALDLMPNESARISLKVVDVSDLSRPVLLVYIPTGLEMDISAWA